MRKPVLIGRFSERWFDEIEEDPRTIMEDKEAFSLSANKPERLHEDDGVEENNVKEVEEDWEGFPRVETKDQSKVEKEEQDWEGFSIIETKDQRLSDTNQHAYKRPFHSPTFNKYREGNSSTPLAKGPLKKLRNPAKVQPKMIVQTFELFEVSSDDTGYDTSTKYTEEAHTHQKPYKRPYVFKLQQSIRDYTFYLIKHSDANTDKNYRIFTATSVEVDRFDRTRDASDGPSLSNFKIDLSSPYSFWNKQLAALCSDMFMTSEYAQAKEFTQTTVYRLFFSHLQALQLRLVESEESALIHHSRLQIEVKQARKEKVEKNTIERLQKKKYLSPV